MTASRTWGLGRTKAHELAPAGELPCRPVPHIGCAYQLTRADLLRSVGIYPGNSVAGPAQDRPATNSAPTKDLTDGHRTTRRRSQQKRA